MATFIMNSTSIYTSHPDVAGPVSNEDADQAMALQLAGQALYRVCAPVIVLLGTFGNIMTVAVMQTMTSGHSSSMSVYFTALAVSDLIILYAGLFRRWLTSAFGLLLVNVHDFFCKTFHFLVFTCGMTSSWFLVAVTLQRVASVVFPHKVQLLCSPKKSQLVVVVLVICLACVNLHIPFLYEIHESDKGEARCQFNDNEHLIYYDLYIHTWLDLSLSSLLPFAILIVGNVLLVRKVSKSVQTVSMMTSSKISQVGIREKRASSLTITVISISVTFLLLTSPLSAFLITQRDGKGYGYSFQFAWYVSNLLWYVNSAVNFYLYCLTGTKFRSKLKGLFCKTQSSYNARHSGTRIPSVSMTLQETSTTATRMLERRNNVDDAEDF